MSPAWRLAQIAFRPVSDRYGRKVFIVAGMPTQAPDLAGFATATTFTTWTLTTVLLDLGTAAVYPTLLADIRAAWTVAALTAASSLLTWARMYETHPPR